MDQGACVAAHAPFLPPVLLSVRGELVGVIEARPGAGAVAMHGVRAAGVPLVVLPRGVGADAGEARGPAYVPTARVGDGGSHLRVARVIGAGAGAPIFFVREIVEHREAHESKVEAGAPGGVR